MGFPRPIFTAVCMARFRVLWLAGHLSARYGLHAGYFDEPATHSHGAGDFVCDKCAVLYSFAPAFSHATSLFASALFVFVWWRTHVSRASGDWKTWFVLGLSGGLMTMVREQEAVLFVIPLVEGIHLLYRAIRTHEHFGALRKWIAGAVVMVLGAFLVFLPLVSRIAS